MFRSTIALRRCIRNGAGTSRFMSKITDELKDSRTKGPVTFFSLGLALITAAGVAVFYNIEKDKKTKTLAKNIKSVGKPALGGPWVLVDQNGIPRTDASYRGKFALLYFGFTYCPDICPSELVKVSNIIKALEKKKSVELTPLFISVDPSRDTVGQMKNYSQDFHPSFVYLTGTRDQVAVASKAYRVYFSKANENEKDDEDYLVDHSIVLYLVSPDGEFLDFFTQKMEVGEIADKITKHAKEYNEAKKTREAAEK